MRVSAPISLLGKTRIVTCRWMRIFPAVNGLTRQEQTVLCVVITLLLVGWAVKACRIAKPADAAPPGQMDSP